MKYIRICGDLAKAVTGDPNFQGDLEPMPLDFVLDVIELTLPQYPRRSFIDACYPEGGNNATS